MSLDKAIKFKKEKRKPYYDAGRFDTTCRPHGGCPWCYDNRMHKNEIADIDLEEELQELGITMNNTFSLKGVENES